MEKTVLLVVDVQKALAGWGPYNYPELIKNISALLAKFRANKWPVIFIQHDGETGSPFEPGTEGWEIVDEIAPKQGEPVIRKKFNSAFKDTRLSEEITKGGFTTIIIVGMQTEYCIDTTVRVAFEKGFRIIVPEGTNTTFDNGGLSGKDIYEHHNQIFDKRFARVEKMDKVMRELSIGSR
jgi:nicotinamidase-related amidase